MSDSQAPVVTASPAPESTSASQGEQQQPQVAKPSVDEFSTRFAALTKKEKALQEQQAKAKAEAERYAKYMDLEQKAKENPLSVLEAYGVDLDSLLLATLGEKKAPPTVEEQLAELKAQLQKEKDDVKAAEEAKRLEAEKAYQSSIDEAILNHQNAITDLLSKNKDKYELISHHGVEDLVWETTEAYYEQYGKVLTPSEAADMVEEHLFQQTQKALELSKFKKLGLTHPLRQQVRL
jgi:small-conductance mechanosensitive channel